MLGEQKCRTENLSVDEIGDLIETSAGFSEDRADLIAATEMRRAKSQGALASYRGANDIGLTVQKEWILGENPCPAIDVDDDSSSGDDAPAAHPNCECAVSPVVIDDGSGAGSEE